MASITLHKNGWRAQVYVAGKRTSKVFRTQREAKVWGTQREIELRTRRDASPAEIHTVRDLLERYADEVSVLKKGARAEQLRIHAFLQDFP